MESPLLRVSPFCRRRPRPKETTVSLSTMSTTQISSKEIRSHDLSSICFVSLEVLVSLSLYENSFAFLCHGSKRILVRLILMEEGDDDNDAKKMAMAPPIVFTNLGFSSQEQIRSSTDRIPHKCHIIESEEQELPIAKRVVLRPLGRCPKTKWPKFFRNEEKEKEDAWALPPIKTLIQKSNLISIYKSNPDGVGTVYYYEVLEIILEQSTSLVGLSSTSTEYELDGSLLSSSVRRLPPLLSQEYILSSLKTNDCQDIYPKLDKIMKVLFQSPTLDGNEKVLHVIGTDEEHSLRICVESAAKQNGMQYFPLCGLAAFSHHSGSKVRTGSLADQLMGLQEAFKFIRTHRMEPCVLHLYDMDLELSTTDESLRHEQEERFWAHFMKGLSFHSSSDTNEDMGGNELCYTPPVLIVLSTVCSLKPGPFMEKLVFPSIVLETPNLQLAKSLWRNSISWEDSFWDSLKGRTAKDILWLSKKLEGSTTTTPLVTLKKQCKILDAKNKSESSSKVAKVSNVHWDDVGGLSHVRKEILDAIELPLKYPHLFPSSGGRSGILLYGPPGTGKTLVAKAVATECGLPFFSVKGPELLGSYVGESEASVRAIFEEARQAAAQNTPNISASILFFDELDSLAPRRGGVGDGGGVMERVVATLFAELDGSSNAPDEGRVFVMGATNRPDLLDPGLLRPGRLDRLVYLGVPEDDEERTRVLAAQIRKIKLAGDSTEMARQIVSRLPKRLTGADLSTIASGALSHAIHRLCRQADEEQKLMERVRESPVAMDQVLEGWDFEKRTPTVELDDLLRASEEVIPSLSEKDLEHYERLRDQYTRI